MRKIILMTMMLCSLLGSVAFASPSYTTHDFQIRNYSSSSIKGVAIRAFYPDQERIKLLKDFSDDDPVWILRKTWKPAIPRKGVVDMKLDSREDYHDGYVMRVYYNDKKHSHVDRWIELDENLFSFNIHNDWFENIEYVR